MSKATQLIAIAMQADIPVIAIGDPGVAKSMAIGAISSKLGLQLRTTVLAQSDPADVGGYPAIINGEYQIVPPAYIRKSHAKSSTFFDEYTTAPPAVQAVSLRVIRERIAADDETRLQGPVVAAANPAEQVSGSDMIAPASNRFFHVPWIIDHSFIEAWCDYMAGGEGLAADVPILPDTWREGVTTRRAQIAGYIRHRRDPKVLHKLPTAERQGGAWASPRTWEMAAILLGAADSIGATHLIPDILVGCVGEAAAVECLAWLKDANLPDPADVLAGKTKVPTRADAAYATLTAVAALAINMDKALGTGKLTVKQVQESAHRRAWRLLFDLHTAGTHPIDTTALTARRLADSMIRAYPSILEAIPQQEAAPFLEIFKSVAAARGK